MGGGGRVAGLWTLGSVCAMVSAVNCVSLMIHRLVPLKQIIHYMLIKKKLLNRYMFSVGKKRIVVIVKVSSNVCVYICHMGEFMYAYLKISIN